LETDTDDEQDKRAFTLDEKWLITSTAKGGKIRQGCKAKDRAVFYVVAAETGLRLKELKSLRVESFDLGAGTVMLDREHAKDRRAATLPLKAKRVRQLQEYFSDFRPRSAAFSMHKFPKMYLAIEGDLRYARARWIRETKDRPNAAGDGRLTS
jgi:integrase